MNHENGTYVALELSIDSRVLVDEFITHTLQLPNPIHPDYLHSTVIYSTAPVPQAVHLDRNMTAYGHAIRYEIFETKTGKKCLTAIIDCPKAHDLNAMLTTLGATSKFHPYNSHLTLSYDFDGSIDDLPLIPFELYYDSLLVNELDQTFIPPSK